jgi:signal transduction histidine kinase
MMKEIRGTGQNWWRWLVPRPIEWMTLFLYAAVLAVYNNFVILGVYQFEYPWLGNLAILLGIVFFILLDRLEYWHYKENLSWWLNGLFLLIRLIGIVIISLSDGLGDIPAPAYFILLIPLLIFFISGSSYGLSGLVWTMYLFERVHLAGEPPYAHGEPNFIFPIVAALTFTFIISMAYLVRQEKQSHMQAEHLLRELEVSHQHLQDYAEKVADLATTEERNRLAREIHDSLGHYMTVINVQLEKAITFRDRNPQEAEQAVRDAKYLAGEALKDVRRSVGALRSVPEFSLTQSLRELVNTMNSDQLAIELKIEGEETGFSRQSLMTLYRAAQEGLTNIQKHARANQVQVQVRLEDQQASLTIDDNGQGFDSTSLDHLKEKSHYGLQGIRERLELIRGSFALESQPNEGTRLCVTVPKNPLALVSPWGN